MVLLLFAIPAGARSDEWGPGWETYNEEPLWMASVNVTSQPVPDTEVFPLPSAIYIRNFGVSGNATDGFDRYLDIPAPPFPPEESLDASFSCNHELVTRLATDIRPNSESVIWELKLTVPPGSTANVNWDISDVPSDDTLTMACGSQDIDMKGQSFLAFESGTYSLYITTNKETRSKTSSSKSRNSGGGGSGSGGGGGSPEPQSNVEAKELSQQFVANGNPVRFEFIHGVTCIDHVEFDARKSLGKVTTVVEMLKGRSALTQNEPEGRVYRYLNIWVGNGNISTPENIGNATIGFRIYKSWLEENGVLDSSIGLWRYDENVWTQFLTKQTGEDASYIYFEAEVPGFSPFAITGIVQKELETGEINSGKEKADFSYVNTSIEAENSKSPEEETAPGLGIVAVYGLLACACYCRSFKR